MTTEEFFKYHQINRSVVYEQNGKTLRLTTLPFTSTYIVVANKNNSYNAHINRDGMQSVLVNGVAESWSSIHQRILKNISIINTKPPAVWGSPHQSSEEMTMKQFFDHNQKDCVLDIPPHALGNIFHYRILSALCGSDTVYIFEADGKNTHYIEDTEAESPILNPQTNSMYTWSEINNLLINDTPTTVKTNECLCKARHLALFGHEYDCKWEK